MEAAWKSNNIKTEMQASLPPLVVDALVQTEVVSRENEACQTEKSTGIDCEVQANPERRTLCTQTIKQEIQTEIAMPNTICAHRFGLKNDKKREVSSIENSTPSLDGALSSNVSSVQGKTRDHLAKPKRFKGGSKGQPKRFKGRCFLKL